MSFSVQGVHYAYRRREVLKGISFEAKGREILTIMGPNGSGKTTLLKCLNRFHDPEAGTISYEGKDVRRMPRRTLARYMSYVPQDHGTVFPISVVDTIVMGRIPHAGMRISKADRDVAFEALDLMGLHDFAFRPINELSGGERQRVVIARALAQQAPIVLMDEPTGSLDVRNQLETMSLLRSVVEDNGLIAILSLHDINLASMFSHRVAMLKEGRLLESGPVEQVINEANLKSVYGVDTVVNNRSSEIHVRLLKPTQALKKADGSRSRLPTPAGNPKLRRRA